jgi:hypothetical protein
MRIVPALAMFGVLLCGAQAAQSHDWPKEKLYVVECRVVATSPDGQSDIQLGPMLTVAEGRTAVINDVTETPIVASVASRRGGEEPRITVLKEGTTIELVVHDEGRGFVTLDALIETSKITDLKEKEAGNGRRRQCARLESHRVRVMELAALDEEFAVALHGTDGKAKARNVEFTVHAPDAPRHWYSASELQAAAKRKSWLWQMWLVVLRTLAAV